MLYQLNPDVMQMENFAGFEINGLIKPEDYAVNESNLFTADDNLFSVKLPPFSLPLPQATTFPDCSCDSWTYPL